MWCRSSGGVWDSGRCIARCSARGRVFGTACGVESHVKGINSWNSGVNIAFYLRVLLGF